MPYPSRPITTNAAEVDAETVRYIVGIHKHGVSVERLAGNFFVTEEVVREVLAAAAPAEPHVAALAVATADPHGPPF